MSGGESRALGRIELARHIQRHLQELLLPAALSAELAHLAGAQTRSQIGHQRLNFQRQIGQLFGIALSGKPELHRPKLVIATAQRHADDAVRAQIHQHTGRHRLLSRRRRHEHQRLGGKDHLTGRTQHLLPLPALGSTGGLLQIHRRPLLQRDVLPLAPRHQPHGSAERLRGRDQAGQHPLKNLPLAPARCRQPRQFGGESLHGLGRGGHTAMMRRPCVSVNAGRTPAAYQLLPIGTACVVSRSLFPDP